MFFSSWILIKKAFETCEILNKKINPSIYSCHTLKPLHENRLKKIFRSTS